MPSETRKLLDRLTQDDIWIDQHRCELLKSYPERWIAVRDRQVIASDPDLDALLGRLKSEDGGQVAIERITAEKMIIIVWLQSAI